MGWEHKGACLQVSVFVNNNSYWLDARFFTFKINWDFIFMPYLITVTSSRLVPLSALLTWKWPMDSVVGVVKQKKEKKKVEWKVQVATNMISETYLKSILLCPYVCTISLAVGCFICHA